MLIIKYHKRYNKYNNIIEKNITNTIKNIPTLKLFNVNN